MILCQDALRMIQDSMASSGDATGLRRLSSVLPMMDKVLIIQLGVWGPQIFVSKTIHLVITYFPLCSILFCLEGYELKLHFNSKSKKLANISISPSVNLRRGPVAQRRQTQQNKEDQARSNLQTREFSLKSNFSGVLLEQDMSFQNTIDTIIHFCKV